MKLLEKEEIFKLEDRTNGYIYFLIDGDEIVYVGQTTSLGSRTREHKNKKKIPHTAFKYIEVPLECMTQYEYEYIIKFRPKYNKSIGGRPYKDTSMYANIDNKKTSIQVFQIDEINFKD